MSMGDGNLNINPKYFNRKKPDKSKRDAFLGTGYNKKETELANNFRNFLDPSRLIKLEKKNKPDSWVRPHNAFYYFEDEIDRFRNILYHEFAHTVHQMKNMTARKNFGLETDVPIEQALIKKVKNISGGATRYSSTNTKEWFAENFSLYHMGREELVDPKFIEFLENEVLKWMNY